MTSELQATRMAGQRPRQNRSMRVTRWQTRYFYTGKLGEYWDANAGLRASLRADYRKTLAAIYRKVGHTRETDESTLQASSHGLIEAKLLPAKSRLFVAHLALRANSAYVANLSVGYGQTWLYKTISEIQLFLGAAKKSEEHFTNHMSLQATPKAIWLVKLAATLMLAKRQTSR